MIFRLYSKLLGGAVIMQAIQLSACQAQVVWEILPKENQKSRPSVQQISETSGSKVRKEFSRDASQNDWSLIAPSESKEMNEWKSIEEGEGSGQKDLLWETVPDVDVLLDQERLENSSSFEIPNSFDEAEAMLNTLFPQPDDFIPPLQLGQAVPTANQLLAHEHRFSTFQLSPFKTGESGGTGNQNYAARFDMGITDKVQLSGFVSQADDPLHSQLNGYVTQPANYWESYGGAIKIRLASDDSRPYEDSPGKYWNLALTGSVESWNVGSGGCDSANCKANDGASPNIFNDSGKRVFTRNIVGSVALPFSWNLSPGWQVSLSPGASFLPGIQGSGQGGEGEFYGNNVWMSAGALWTPIPELEMFGSSLIPFGPGNNSFDEDIDFTRVPIFSGGLTWNLNPRIGLEGIVTNGWGATPATALLALPSSNQIGYSARFRYTADAADTPQPSLSPRQLSLASGGLTVNTALVPPDRHTQAWLNTDNKGNLFAFLGYSISNIFQVDLYQAGIFRGVNTFGGEPSESLAKTYTTTGGWNWRVGGKGVALSPLRGAPFWTAGRLSFGRNNDVSSYQGYVFAESINTWEATSWLALNLNPKLGWSGVSDPWGVGLSANIQLSHSFQLIPEINIVGSHFDATNGTVSFRWLAQPETTHVDIYLSNAAGLFDMGQLIRSEDMRFGGKISFIF